MDAMMLAQLKRNAAGHAEEVHHDERNLRAAELALENAKKNAETLKKKLVESRRKLEQFNKDVRAAEDEVRRKIANERGQ